MDATHTVTLQVTISYEGEGVDWEKIIENSIEEIAEDSAMSDPVIVLEEVSVERID